MKKDRTQIKLILSIFGEYFSIDELTNLMKIKPTQTWTKGDIIPLPQGLCRKDNSTRIREYTNWEFSIGFIETLDFEDVSKCFEDIFENKIIILKNYIQEKGIEAVMNIIVEVYDNQSPGIHLNSQIIKISRALNAEIDIDLYIMTNDDGVPQFDN
ncbi:DUF4279 domain-containing protein [Odoribacter sp. OttesenSCG-928-G04]|nr:DUF4279 domain-containing protein [Odoribacter sp. OttesenSCG-928-G04]